MHYLQSKAINGTFALNDTDEIDYLLIKKHKNSAYATLLSLLCPTDYEQDSETDKEGIGG